MTPVWRRNPAVAGIAGIVLVALALLGVARFDQLPLIGGGDRELTAEFTDASGLEPGNRVEIAGIAVGSVDDITMGRGRVVVHFSLDQAVRLGTSTRALIRVGNLLGNKYLEIVPSGAGRLDASRAIPLERTEPAYDVVAAFGELTETVEDIDTDQLASSLEAVASTFRGSTDDVRSAVRGLSDISRTIASRDDDVQSLLTGAETLTSSLDGSKADITALLQDATLLLAEIDKRRDSLDGLIVHTRQLSDELRGLVKDNQAQIGPALDELEQVTSLLEKRQEQLGKTVHSVARFARVFSNTIGSGPWFDSIIGNAPNSLVVGGQK